MADTFDLAPFYSGTLQSVVKDMPGALQQMTQSQRESIGMQRQALDAYRGALAADDGVNLPMMKFSAALGAPTRGGLGGALANGMDAYAGALALQRQSNLSKAEKLMLLQQGLAKLHSEEGGLGMGQVNNALSAATKVGTIDELSQNARAIGAYNRAFGPNASATGVESSALPPLPAPTVAEAADRAAATGQVAQAQPRAQDTGPRLSPEAMQTYRKNQQTIQQSLGFPNSPQWKAAADRAKAENERMVPTGVFIKPDGTFDTTALRIANEAKRADTPMSATEKTAIIDADEKVAINESAISSLNQAKEISKKALGFPGAGVVGKVGSLVGNDASSATVELNNLVTEQALTQLKAIFGAAPTEGERKILLDIQGSVGLPDAVRQKIFDRAIQAAQRRLEFNRQTAAQMRGGSYFKPGQGPNAGSPPPPTTTTEDPYEAEARRRGLIK